MTKHYRTFDQIMMSLGDKEATYNAGPAAWTAGAAYQLREFSPDSFVRWEDGISTDEDTVHGSEYPTADEIAAQDVRIGYQEPRVRPVSLAGLMAAAGGTIVSVQDGALAAYRHKITPVATADQPPSFGVQAKTANAQYKYHGIKVDQLTLRRGGDRRQWWTLDVPLIGSGHRAAAADAFPDKIDQTPLRWTDVACWMESGANISIAATPVQGSQNLSSATPDALTDRLIDAVFNWQNRLIADDSSYVPGSGAQRGELDHGRRDARLTLTAFRKEATWPAEVAYYEDREDLALELQVDSGEIIAATGAMKYGFDIIIPRARLQPITEGVDGEGRITTVLNAKAFDDGVNPLWIGYVYCEQPAFLA